MQTTRISWHRTGLDRGKADARDLQHHLLRERPMFKYRKVRRIVDDISTRDALYSTRDVCGNLPLRFYRRLIREEKFHFAFFSSPRTLLEYFESVISLLRFFLSFFFSPSLSFGRSKRANSAFRKPIFDLYPTLLLSERLAPFLGRTRAISRYRMKECDGAKTVGDCVSAVFVISRAHVITQRRFTRVYTPTESS